MAISFIEFVKFGREQRLAENPVLHRAFLFAFGPLGVHTRIRTARVINKVVTLDLPENAKILDVACGHAYGSFYLAKKFKKYRILALDIDMPVIRKNIQAQTRLGLDNLAFSQQDAEHISASNEYDLIICIDYLEHIMDDVGALRSFKQALKSQGKLVIHVPKKHQEHSRFLPVFKNHITEDHVRDEYLPEEIEEKLRDAGYDILSLSYGFGRWGEISFELNNLFWENKFLRTIAAIFFFPLSLWLGYIDTKQVHKAGNSILVVVKPKL